jgi:hypothetical protein
MNNNNMTNNYNENKCKCIKCGFIRRSDDDWDIPAGFVKYLDLSLPLLQYCPSCEYGLCELLPPPHGNKIMMKQ